MFQLFLIILSIITSFLICEEGYATYIPGSNISLTGSNSMVRFDVRSDLFGFDSIPAALDTTKTSPTFTGAFYGSGIGWIVFSSGSNQVTLDCGAQSLSSLSTNCHFSGTGWSENMGDIDFSGVDYNPTTGLLIGAIVSNMGDIPLDGIALPLRPVILDTPNFIASHNSILSVSGSWQYNGGIVPWNLSLMPIATADIRNFGGSLGQFSNVDISLATTYEAKIIDSNGSETTFNITVDPNTLTTIYTSSYYSEAFCTSNPLYPKCPDGNTRVASSLLQVPPVGTVVANATDMYHFTLKSRDTYGNRIENGSMKVKYLTTVKNIQTDPFSATGNINYGPSTDGDAFASVELGSGLGGTLQKIFPLSSTDITYGISSSAPSNTTDNIIKLDSVTYISGAIETIIPTINSSLIFDPLYGININSGVPTIAVPNTFDITVTKNDPSSTIVPNIITTLLINDGLSAEWRNMASAPGATCAHEPATGVSDPLCDWTDVSSIATNTNNDFTFTGTYTAKIPNPPLETSYVDTYVEYMNGPITVLYRGAQTNLATPNVATQRLQVIGQTSDTLGAGIKTRVDTINKIRAKVALLSRNRTNYDDSDIFVVQGNYTIDASSTLFAGEPGKKPKRAIIAIGGDITIGTNIAMDNHPVAIISLSDMNNQGGNIHIQGAVTDIHASLIAEHGIISDVSNYQLYIHGVVVSANAPKELAPSSCPFFAPSGCNTSDYDLPSMRAGYTAPTNSSMGGSSYTHPLIIETDPRLITDAPNILMQ